MYVQKCKLEESFLEIRPEFNFFWAFYPLLIVLSATSNPVFFCSSLSVHEPQRETMKPLSQRASRLLTKLLRDRHMTLLTADSSPRPRAMLQN